VLTDIDKALYRQSDLLTAAELDFLVGNVSSFDDDSFAGVVSTIAHSGVTGKLLRKKMHPHSVASLM